MHITVNDNNENLYFQLTAPDQFSQLLEVPPPVEEFSLFDKIEFGLTDQEICNGNLYFKISQEDLSENKLNFKASKLIALYNLKTIENSALIAKLAHSLITGKRNRLVRWFADVLDKNLGCKTLKVIFNDLLEKKEDKKEIELFTYAFDEATIGKFKKANDMEEKLFSTYNVKHPAFKMLGADENKLMYFFNFSIDSCNFLVQAQTTEKVSSLQFSILKSIAGLLNQGTNEVSTKEYKKPLQ